MNGNVSQQRGAKTVSWKWSYDFQVSQELGCVCTILDNSMLKCFGTNSYGQLGLGDTLNRGDNPQELGDYLPVVNLGKVCSLIW